jgi:phenylacetate-coenzyme A ligase PaaK-like adenylate-forming protein
MVLVDSQWLDRDEMEEYQLGHLKALVGFAAREVPFWRSRIAPDVVEDATTLRDALARLPILPREELRDESNIFRAGKLPNGEVPAGTPASPDSLATTELHLRWQRALSLRGYLWAGLDFNRSIAIARPGQPDVAEHPHGVRQSSWGLPSEVPFRSGPSFQLNTRANLEDQWAWLSRVAPAYLCTSPSLVRGYARLAHETQKLTFDKILVAGEVVDDGLRSLAATRLNAAIHDCYASQEAGCMAIQCPETDAYHVQSEAIIVEVLNEQGRPCRPGEIGRVVVTPLFNLAMPLIRYEIGDFAEMGEQCTCGRSLPMLNRIMGGRRNRVIAPDGVPHPSRSPDSENREYTLSESTDPSETPARISGRTFDMFDTLVARRCVVPREIFHIVERVSGHAGFARARIAAEKSIFTNAYTLDDIYRRLGEDCRLPEQELDRLKQLELATEKENLFPIAQHCSEFGSNDVVVSDMYLSAEWLKTLLKEKCNLRTENIIVSSHGKLNRTVWAPLKQRMQVEEHVGDNPITDQASPQAAGIPARLTTVSRRTLVEEELASIGFAPLSNLIREARLTSWNSVAELRKAQIEQIQLNFPLLFAATLHLQKQSVKHGWDRILMSGRDCYLWQGLYESMRPLLPGAPSSTYFYTSRIARTRPSPSYGKYFNHLRTGQRNVVVDLCGTGLSLTRLLEQVAGPPTEIFLLHKLEGLVSRQIELHSVIARAPERLADGKNNDVLEELNRAPHDMVEDVQEEQDSFVPVYCSVSNSRKLAGLIQSHHGAFAHASALLGTLTQDEIEAMLDSDIVLAIESLYRRMADLSAELGTQLEQHWREEELVWQTLSKDQQRSITPLKVLIALRNLKQIAAGSLAPEARVMRRRPTAALNCTEF